MNLLPRSVDLIGLSLRPVCLLVLFVRYVFWFFSSGICKKLFLDLRLHELNAELEILQVLWESIGTKCEREREGHWIDESGRTNGVGLVG